MTVRRKSKRLTKQTSQLDLLTYAAKSRATAENLRGLLSVKTDSDEWRGLIATPPGSLLETVVACFKNRTNIPLELPFFSTLSFVSGHLLNRGVKLNFAGQKIRPDIWTILLAESGAGKTFATSSIKKALGVTDTFPECVSGAAFVESMKDQNNSLWIRDEFGQFLKMLDTQQGAEIKDYLLRTFDGDLIERKTKQGTVRIDEPALAILGMTVIETFPDCVQAESLLDGFAQRFNYVIAKRDPERKMIDFPLFDLSGYREKMTTAWDALQCVQLHDEYKLNAACIDAFKMSFSMFAGDSIPESFYRRIMFRSMKYALVYHFLRSDESDTLTAEDFGWSARVCWLHLQDAAELLKTHVASDLERTLVNAEAVVKRILAKGERVTPRLIVQGVYAIKTVAEARAVLTIIGEDYQARKDQY